MPDTQKFLDVALEAVKLAEPIFVKHFGNASGIAVKREERTSLVSDADKDVECILRKSIHEAFPAHTIVGEEAGSSGERSSFVWYLDPIDGTTNFIRGLLPTVISVGLFDVNGPLVTVISSPATGVLYHAVRGRGAFKNGKKISVSEGIAKERLIGAFGWKHAEKGPAVLKNLLKVVRTARILGCDGMQLALVAEGTLDCFVTNEAKLWDVAAGLLLVSEAGGEVGDWKGSPFQTSGQSLVASNGKIHQQLLAVFK